MCTAGQSLGRYGLLCAPATGGLTQHMVTSCIWFRWDVCLQAGNTLTQFGWWYLLPALVQEDITDCITCRRVFGACASRALSFPNTPWHPWPGFSLKALVSITAVGTLNGKLLCKKNLLKAYLLVLTIWALPQTPYKILNITVVQIKLKTDCTTRVYMFSYWRTNRKLLFKPALMLGSNLGNRGEMVILSFKSLFKVV